MQRGIRTRGKRLLELLGLVGVLQNQGVDEALASDLELDVAGLLVLLYACSCKTCQQLFLCGVSLKQSSKCLAVLPRSGAFASDRRDCGRASWSTYTWHPCACRSR